MSKQDHQQPYSKGDPKVDSSIRRLMDNFLRLKRPGTISQSICGDNLEKRIHQSAEKVNALSVEISQADYVHQLDKKIIKEHTERLHVLKDKEVWKGSPASPEVYVLVDIETFLKRYDENSDLTHFTCRSFLDDYNPKNAEDVKAIAKIHELDSAMQELKGYLLKKTDGSAHARAERKKEYGNLIRGIYNNEIVDQINDIKYFKKGQFAEDLELIWNEGYRVVNWFMHNDPDEVISSRKILFKKIDEDHLKTNYSENGYARMVIEKLMVKSRMMYNTMKLHICHKKDTVY